LIQKFVQSFQGEIFPPSSDWKQLLLFPHVLTPLGCPSYSKWPDLPPWHPFYMPPRLVGLHNSPRRGLVGKNDWATAEGVSPG